MEVRAGGDAGVSHLSDLLALPDPFTGLDTGRVQMRVKGLIAFQVFERDVDAMSIVLTHILHGAARDSHDRRPGSRGDVKGKVIL